MKSGFQKLGSVLVYSVVLACLVLNQGVLAAKEKRMVTDQLGRQVEIPRKINRAVVLMHHALDVVAELGAQDQVVGILKDWKKYLPAGFQQAWPGIEKLSTPGDLRKSINIEELLALNPDVVIITHYMIEKTGKQIAALGVPVIGISMYKADYQEAAVLNPELKDAGASYSEGLKEGVRLLGEVFGKQQRAEKLLAHVFQNRELVRQRLGSIPSDQRISTYMAYPNLYSMGTGKYASMIMELAGGRNVAMELKGYSQVSMENVLQWNPQVIFTQARYSYVADEIMGSDQWQSIDAVKNKKVYITPEYVKPWGHPCPESVGLGELWMAKKLYPEKFRDIDLQGYVDDFYQTFYGVPYRGNH